MRLVMMGTGPFAVPTFEALLESPHQMLALVTRPDRPVHDKHKQSAPRNPMREVAQRGQLEIVAPESVNSAEAIQRLSDWRADLFVVCDYGQILCGSAGGRSAWRDQPPWIAAAEIPRGCADPMGRFSRRDRNRSFRDPHDAAAGRRACARAKAVGDRT